MPITSILELKCWVKTQLLIQNTSQMELAKRLNVAYPRISEAINGHPSAKRYIPIIIEELGGNIDEFKAVI